MKSRNNSKESSNEAFAYTPGLKVKNNMIVVKERKLPIKGDVLVKKGENVSYDTIVAKTQLSGDPYIVSISDILGLEPRETKDFMKKKKGDFVNKDEALAVYSAFFGLMKKSATSPITGTFEEFSDITGQCVVRGEQIPIEIRAYIPGKIIKVIPGEGVEVECNGALLQGIFGLGGETHGKIKISTKKENEVLTPDLITKEDKDCILVGGSYVPLETVKKAIEIGVKGIITGGILSQDLKELMGEEVGVAITGQEEIGITLIITEGFGSMNMSQKAFNLLKHFEGHITSINGATQIRAGVIRPEIIIPHEEPSSEDSKLKELMGGMMIGTSVRIISDPYFGAIGKVSSLPVELEKIETESEVRILGVVLEDGKQVTVPRANVEIIEE